MDLEQIALVVAPIAVLDDDAAADDPIGEAIELVGLLTDAGFQRRRGLHVAERDL